MRSAAIQTAGFTARQARFLVLVLKHSGVCLPRQYRTFAGIAHGRQTHRFFDKLITGGFATTDLSASGHAGLICGKSVQRASRGDTRLSEQPVSRSRLSVGSQRQRHAHGLTSYGRSRRRR